MQKKQDVNTKREQYREKRGEEYDIVSKVAYLIGVPDTHWRSEYTGLDTNIYEQLNENKDARIIRNLCSLRTEIERNFKRFSILSLRHKAWSINSTKTVSKSSKLTQSSKNIFLKSTVYYSSI